MFNNTKRDIKGLVKIAEDFRDYSLELSGGVTSTYDFKNIEVWCYVSEKKDHMAVEFRVNKAFIDTFGVHFHKKPTISMDFEMDTRNTLLLAMEALVELIERTEKIAA